MKSILVTVRDENLVKVIGEVLDSVSAEMVNELDPTLEQIEQIMPALIIVDYTEDEKQADSLFKSTTEFEATSKIPFMFIIPESGKWNEIDGFRLGFDTKVSKERPKLGIQLRVQAILKKSRAGEDTSGRAKDLQHIMQSILKKTKGGNVEENTGSFNVTKSLPTRTKILIVEDEALTRDVLQAALERSYDLVFAPDGEKGYAKALSERPDLIISDFNMPIMDGLQLLEKVRSTPEFKHTPFVFLTAKNSVDDKIEGLEQGADEYLGKPFSVRELQLRVDRLAEQVQNRRVSSGALQGQLAEVGLPDVLQIIANNKKTGELQIALLNLREPIKIFFKDGSVVNATFGKNTGLKALFRILALDAGSFYFETKPCNAKQVINDKIENLLLEGYRQMDEFEMLSDRFSAGFSAVLRPGTEKAVSSGLSTVDAIVLFAVGAHASVQEVIDKVTFTDFETLESIINLLDAGLIMTE